MTVIFYDKGEHEAGFVGYRAAGTCGRSDRYEQCYFSLNHYSKKEAKKLAEAFDENIKQKAKEHLIENLFKKKVKLGFIAVGLKAFIKVEKKIRAGELRVYYSAHFKVTKRGYGAGSKDFSIRKNGYDYAYIQACKFYIENRGLSASEHLLLMARKPPVSLFYDKLIPDLIKKGHVIDRNSIYLKKEAYQAKSKYQRKKPFNKQEHS